MHKFILLVCIYLPFVLGDGLFGNDNDIPSLDNNSSKRVGLDPKVVMALMKHRLLNYYETRLLGTLRPTRKKHFPFHPLVRFKPTTMPDALYQEEVGVSEPPERSIEDDKSVNAAEMLAALNAAWYGKGKATTIGSREEIKSLRYGFSK